MPDHPILFSADMIRALLAGTKTQTRRVLKSPPPNNDFEFQDYFYFGDDEKQCASWSARYPAGDQCHTCALPHEAGDHLWVREAWRPLDGYSNWDLQVRYAADGEEKHFGDGDYNSDWNWPKAAKKGDVPSIHMPRWASRITLNVTDVKIERLQDISEADAIAEGCRPFFDDGSPRQVPSPNGGAIEMMPLKGPIDAYEHLWNSINGPDAWVANPWVVATSFEVKRGNIDGRAA